MDRENAFKAVQVVGEDWAHVAQACVDALDPLPEGANIGFLYVTDVLSTDMPSVLTYLRQRTGITHWVGGIGAMICGIGGEMADMPAAAAMAAALPNQSFHVLNSLKTDLLEIDDATWEWISDKTPALALLHGDPANPDIVGLVESLAEKSGAFLVGGLTSARVDSVQLADRIMTGGLTGVLFAPEVGVATGMSQGCRPIGEPHVVSDALENVMVGLDGEKALDVLTRETGAKSRDELQALAGRLHIALLVEGSDMGDYMVRNLVAIDPTRGWIGIGGEIAPGTRIQFVERDPISAELDLRRMAENIKGRLDNTPKGGVYVSCVARGVNMFGKAGRELAILNDVLGDFPLVGFHSAGEISHNRVYGYTGVLTLFT